ncbi:MAG: hypothetical protein LBR13_06700 [Dysgonamonadaceae bacterium]|jgi:hypothetical protein|nr:hypothetical protein [Dysgonamonadaceae bacterium]
MVLSITNLEMQIDLSAAIAAITVIVGWFVISLLDRRNEITKERRSYRLKMLQSYMNLFFRMEQLNSSRQSIGELPEIPPLSQWQIIRVRFMTYGMPNEYQSFIEIMQLARDCKFFDESLKEKADYKNCLDPNDAEEADKSIRHYCAKQNCLENYVQIA